MHLLTFTVICFAVSIAVTQLHAFGWLRRLVSGLWDKEWYPFIARDSQRNDFDPTNHRIRKFRVFFLGRLIRCPACIGFWVGLTMSYYFYENLILAVQEGFWALGINYIAWALLVKIGAKLL